MLSEFRLFSIVGMHRSGTSLAARVLQHVGVELGPEDALLAPHADNPDGFSEHVRLSAVNRELLEQLGGSWSDPPLPEPGWERDPRWDPLRARAAAELRAAFPAGARAAAWKDPRTSLLLPFWSTAAAIDAVVLVVRDPAEVAASLAVRNGTEPQRAAHLWLRYTVAAWRGAADPVVLRHDDLFTRLDAALDALTAALALPAPDAAARARIAAVRDHALRHHRDPGFGDGPQMRLAKAVHRGLVAGDRAAVDGLADHLDERWRDERRRAAGERRTAAELEGLREQVRLLDEELEDRARRLEQAGTDAQRARREAAEARRAADRDRARLARLRARRSVRAVLRIADGRAPLVAAARRVAVPLARTFPGAAGRLPDRVRGALVAPAAAPASGAPAVTAFPVAAGAFPVPGALLERLAARAPVTVVVPIHNAAADLAVCLDALVRNTTVPCELLLIDDASTDPAVGEVLARHAGRPGVRVLRNDRNLGFTGTVNRGFDETAGDVVLLNSDAEVGPRWLENLLLAVHADDRIATATAVSDNAGAFSVPRPGPRNPTPAWLGHDEVARLVTRTSARIAPRTPTGNGFCLYVRRAALDAVGTFDVARFPRGYGEENDFCMRALHAGWTHVVDDATHVAHRREASFGPEKLQLMKDGRAQVDARFPDYTAKVRAFLSSPELRAVQERVDRAFADDAARWAARPRVLFVLHQGSGGTPQTNLDLMRALSDRYECFTLTATPDHLRLWHLDGELTTIGHWPRERTWQVTDTTDADYRRIVAEILVRHDIALVHVRHLLAQPLDLPSVAAALSVPVVLSFHDFYLCCPTVHLLDENKRFCGGTCTPGAGDCAVPSGWLQETPPLKHRWVKTWQAEVGAMLASVDAAVTTSVTARDVHLATYPQLADRPFPVIEHGRDLARERPVAVPPPAEGRVRILASGNLDVHKGTDFLEALAALDGGRRLEFHFLGKVARDRLDGVGVRHGPYRREEFAARARAIRPSFAAIFSIWPETYSHTLSEAWSVGLPVLATDMGALRERVRAHGGGWLLDPADPERAYAEILRIAGDTAGWHEAAGRAAAVSLRSTARMAEDYDALYRDVLRRRRAFARHGAAREVVRVAAIVPTGTSGPPPSAHIRVLRRLGHPDLAPRVLHALAGPDEVDGDRFDLLLVQRTAVAPHLVDDLLARRRQAGLPLVYELDDDLLDVHGERTAQYGPFRDAVQRLLAEADLVTVSTPALAERVAGLARAVEVVPNLLDERLWLSPLAVPDRGRPADDPLRLVYVGSRTHAADLALVRPALARLAAAGRPVELSVVGGEKPGPGQAWYRRVDIPEAARSYPAFVRWLREQAPRWDAGLAPLAATRFNACKSDLKVLEYAALGLPLVASRFGPYAATVRDGETGLLADDDPAAWADAIARLADPALRASLAAAALAEVVEHRLLRHGARSYAALLASVRAPTPAVAEQRV